MIITARSMWQTASSHSSRRSKEVSTTCKNDWTQNHEETNVPAAGKKFQNGITTKIIIGTPLPTVSTEIKSCYQTVTWW